MSGRKLIVAFIFCLGLIAGLNHCMSSGSNWKGALPKQLAVSKTIAAQTDWLGSPGGGCGGAIFLMSKKTQAEVEKQEIDYFENMNQPRNWENSRIEWSEIQSNDSSEYGDLTFGCIVKAAGKKHSIPQRKLAYSGVMSGEAYKTRILVIPENRYVYIGYWD